MIIQSNPHLEEIPSKPPAGYIVLKDGTRRPVVHTKAEAYDDMHLCLREGKLRPSECPGVEASIAASSLLDPVEKV